MRISGTEPSERPIYTICFDRPVSKQTKSQIAHTRVYTVCLTELSMKFSSKNYFFCLHNFNMEYYNLVMPVCMLMKTTAYCNVLV